MEKSFRNGRFYRNHCLHRGLFTPDECARIIACFNSQPFNQASVMDVARSRGNDVSSKIENSIRRGHLVFFNRYDQSTRFVFDKLEAAAAESNFGWDLVPLEFIQVTEYNANVDGGFYLRHRDIIVEQNPQRILSSVTQLSARENYTGCELVFDPGAMMPEPSTYSDLGDTLFFLSDEPHEVRPIASGVRYSIVGWFQGPPCWNDESLPKYF